MDKSALLIPTGESPVHFFWDYRDSTFNNELELDSLGRRQRLHRQTFILAGFPQVLRRSPVDIRTD